MNACARAALVLLAVSGFAGSLPAQHCLGVGSGPVFGGYARGSIWTGEHRYASRKGAAIAAAHRRLVGSVSLESLYDREFAASMKIVGLGLVADVPADSAEGLWFCPALRVDFVLGPDRFAIVGGSRDATDISVGLGVALPIAVPGRVRIIPSLGVRHITTSERWTFEDRARRRRGSFIEIGTGVQILFGEGFAIAALVQVPFPDPDELTFPFWRARGETAWQLALSHQLAFRGR